MELVEIITSLVAALAYVVKDAVKAFVDGDPSKLEKVQSILPPDDNQKSAEIAILEREKTRRALGG